MIRKEKGKFILYTEKGDRKLGTHPTEAAARAQEAREAGHRIPKKGKR